MDDAAGPQFFGFFKKIVGSPHEHLLRRPREHLTEREVEKLIEAATRAIAGGQRDSTMLLMTFRHGLRASLWAAMERR